MSILIFYIITEFSHSLLTFPSFSMGDFHGNEAVIWMRKVSTQNQQIVNDDAF